MAHPDDHPPCCSTHRAFVVPCAADTAGEDGYLAGRAEHVVSRQPTDVPLLEGYWRPSPQVLHHARQCVPDGAHLLLVDFWTDPTHTQPVLTALMAGELLIHSGAMCITRQKHAGGLPRGAGGQWSARRWPGR
jgi:hypothetical protein